MTDQEFPAKMNNVAIYHGIDDKVYYIKGKSIVEAIVSGFVISKQKGGALKVVYKLEGLSKGKDSKKVYKDRETARKAYFGDLIV